MKPILVDTGVLVALLDRSERYHAACVRALRNAQGPLVSCEAVVAEAAYLLRGVSGASAAVLANVTRGLIRLPFRLEENAGRVSALMQKYKRVPMDLADACLVCLAEDQGAGRILTLDSDFHVYRWAETKPFENLVSIS